MANALFAKALEGFATKQIDWLNDNIKAVLVDHGTDTPNVATDQYLSDIAAGARVATSGNLTSKTATDGVLDAADVTFSLVSGASCESIVVYQDTGNAATSRLIAYIDTGTGLPVTPGGGDITITWDNGANKIGKL
jgi:hypothetical protein